MYRTIIVIAWAGWMLAGCAPSNQVKPTTITLAVDDSADVVDPDLQKVFDALAMLQAGQIQLAVDGPLTEVIDKYEAMYGDKPVRVFCARGVGDALMYAAIGAESAEKDNVSTQVLGSAWSQAYWARAYAYTEMGRYVDARVELEKALALSPLDSQYKSELAFTYQPSAEWVKMLELYREAENTAEFTATETDVPVLKCVALRGQGYALVELRRLDEATRAYQDCLKLMPDEPKSLAELGYIDGLRKAAR